MVGRKKYWNEGIPQKEGWYLCVIKDNDIDGTEQNFYGVCKFVFCSKPNQHVWLLDGSACYPPVKDDEIFGWHKIEKHNAVTSEE